MSSFNWVYAFDPAFPVHIFPFTVIGNRDSMHWHDYYEIGLCVEGTGKFVYLDKVYTVGPGDVFVTNNVENHVAITQGNEVSKYIFLIFLPTFLANPDVRPQSLQYLSFLHYKPAAFQNKIEASCSGQLRRLIHEAHSIYEAREVFWELALDIKVRQILLTLSRHYASGSDAHQGQDVINVKIVRAIKYLNDHYSERVTIKRVASALSLSPSYFRHLFKENMQTSFKAYLTQLRIAQARKLLLATDRSVYEIIADVGYTNVGQFYRIFRQHSQMTPAEYRKHYRENG